MSKLRIALSVVLIAGIFLLSFTGCLRDIQDTADELENIKSFKWNPELALPLIKTELTPGDLLKQYNIDVVRTDADGLLHFIYQDQYLSVYAHEIFQIENQEVAFTRILSPTEASALQGAGSVSFTMNMDLDLTIADMEVDSMLMKACDHVLQLTSSLQHDLSIDVVFPDVTKDGTPYSLNINSPYSGSSHNINRNNSLAGYTFDCTNGPQSYNQLRMELDITITKNGSNPVNPGDFIAFNNSFNNNLYRIFWGYGKQHTLFLDRDSIEITIFSNRQQGSFSVINPRFVVTIGNSFGAPIECHVNNLTAFSPQVGDEVLTGIPSPLPIPTPTNAQIGQMLYDSVVLDNNTSNIASIINNHPHGIFFDLNAGLNPAGSLARNFVMDTSRFLVNLFADIPLDGTARDFVLERVQDFELDIDSSFDDIDYALFRINVDNGFPVDLGLQLYFEDDNGLLIDSMFDGPLVIKTAAVDGTGRVSSATNTLKDVRVDYDKYHRLQKATKMRVRARIETPFNTGGTQDRVRFFSEYRMGLKIGVQTKLSIVTN